jgi:hypothetical protein
MDVWQTPRGTWQTADTVNGGFVECDAPDEATAISTFTDYFTFWQNPPVVPTNSEALAATLVAAGVLTQDQALAAVPSAAVAIQAAQPEPAQPAPAPNATMEGS